MNEWAEPSFPSGPEREEHSLSPELEQRRTRVRQRFRRANTAIAGILIAVLVLAVAAVLAGLRATQNQRRAEQAEQAGRDQLRHAYLAQARAARLSGRMGRRALALDAVKQATAIRTGPELRDEAIAALALSDLEPDIPISPSDRQAAYCAFVPRRGAYLLGDYRGHFTLRALPEHREILRVDTTATRLGTNRLVLDCIASRDGRFFAVSFKDGAVAVFELEQGGAVFTHKPANYGGLRMDFTADGSWFGFDDRDRGGELRVVELPSGQEHALVVKPKSAPFAFRPGTTQIAFAEGKEVRIVDAGTGVVVQALTTPVALTDLLWSGDGRRLAGAAADKSVCLWLLDTGEFHALSGHSSPLRSAAFSPSGDILMTGSDEGETRLWDCALGRELIRTAGGIGMDFSLDGSRVGYFVLGAGFGTWRLERGAGFRTLVGRGGRGYLTPSFDLSPDGRWLVQSAPAGFEIWDLTTQKPAQLVAVAGLGSATLQPDGRAVALCRAGEFEFRSLAPSTTSNEVASLGMPKPVALPPNTKAKQAALSCDGGTAAVELNDLRTVVLDLRGERQPVFLEGRSQLFFYHTAASSTGSGRLAVSADGRWVAIGYGPALGTQVYDARTGKVVKSFDGRGGATAFSADGRFLVTTTAEGYNLWRVGSWERLWERPQAGLNGKFPGVAFSGNGALLATMSGRHSLALLDTETQTVLARLEAPEPQSLTNVRLSANGTRVIAATGNNLAQVWDLAALRRELATLRLDSSAAPMSAVALPKTGADTGAVAAWFGILGAAVACVAALVVLRRNRQLAGEVAQTEELIARREHELRAERELHRIKSSFVSTVSHEFRTPLGVIMSAAEVLKDYAARMNETRRQEHLTDIVEAAGRMNHLISEVLLLGRVESGRMQCSVKPLDLPSLCRKIIESVAAATQRRCSIALDDGGLNGKMSMDESLVTIILTNLLSNAVKYSAAGRLVRLALRRAAAYVVLEVSDEGIGIPAEDQAHLFKTFRRGGNVGDAPGTGLGLTIVKRCVELHTGGITFTSVEGAGTTFTVRLPAFAPV